METFETLSQRNRNSTEDNADLVELRSKLTIREVFLGTACKGRFIATRPLRVIQAGRPAPQRQYWTCHDACKELTSPRGTSPGEERCDR